MRLAGGALVVLLAHAVAWPAAGQTLGGPDTVVVQSGALKLRALAWRPEGQGPFPAVLFNPGSGPADTPLAPHRTALGPSPGSRSCARSPRSIRELDGLVAAARAMALAAEMERLGKPHRVKIYPLFGRTADEGYDFVYLGMEEPTSSVS